MSRKSSSVLSAQKPASPGSCDRKAPWPPCRVSTSLFPIAPPVDGPDVVGMIFPPRSPHSPGINVVRNDVAVVCKLSLAEGADTVNGNAPATLKQDGCSRVLCRVEKSGVERRFAVRDTTVLVLRELSLIWSLLLFRCLEDVVDRLPSSVHLGIERRADAIVSND